MHEIYTKAYNNQYSIIKAYSHWWAWKNQLNSNKKYKIVSQIAPISMKSEVIVWMCQKK